ncbi:Hypothetical protein FKW44_001461 [Caligus rogercresseyi]|uniref:Uncharacterized protein n=1 Tax=Caligus rogercresseyi TaxID=217165 RepID=A0A7T8KJ36_CALRO|nr:Hypothetical protein FKW44_001461 [Caligus rogercresseyi]
MEAKRQRVSDLLRAQVSVAEIVKIVGVSKTMVFDTKKTLRPGTAWRGSLVAVATTIS